MGGIGSGRGFQGGKNVTSDMLALDIRWLKREGLLAPGRSFNMQWKCNGENRATIKIEAEFDCVILGYRSLTNGNEWRSMQYCIYFEWTDCHFGGQRIWFRCPGRDCGRRTAIVYGGHEFLCRNCHQLVYASQREMGCYRAIRQADAIRKRLKWAIGIANPEGGKPKGMHWRTYKQLKTKHDACANAAWATMMLRLVQMERRLARKGLDPDDWGQDG